MLQNTSKIKENSNNICTVQEFMNPGPVIMKSLCKKSGVMIPPQIKENKRKKKIEINLAWTIFQHDLIYRSYLFGVIYLSGTYFC